MKQQHRHVSVFIILFTVSALFFAGAGAVTADEPDSDPPTFEIDSVETGDIRIGSDLEVEVTITNTGEGTGEQDIELIDPPSNVVDDTELSLGEGDTETVTLNWGEITTENDFEIAASTNDDSEFKTIEAPEVDFSITSTTVNDDTPTPGSSITFTTLLRNEGTAGGEEDVNITRVDEDEDEEVIEELDSQTVMLDSLESDEVTFDVSAPTTPGEYSYAINTESDTEIVEDSVQVLEDASFDVSITDTSVENSGIDVTASIENTGEVEDTQRIQFSVDESFVEEKSVELGAGEETTVSFSESVSSDSFRKPVTIESDTSTDSTIVSKASIEDGPSIDTVLPGTVRGGEEVDIMYTADGVGVETVELQVTDPNGERIVDSTVSQGTGETETIEMPSRVDLVNGEYEVKLRVEDADGRVVSDTDSDGILASTVRDPNAIQFGEELYTATAGDYVTVDASVDDSEEMYVLVGGDTDGGSETVQNYFDVLKIDGDGSDLGDVEFGINTRLIGTDKPSEAVYFPISDNGDFTVTSYAHEIGAENQPEEEFSNIRFTDGSGEEEEISLADFRRDIGISSRGGPLQPDTYRVISSTNGDIYIRDDGVPDFEQPIDRTTIELTQPELGSVTTYTAPSGPADELERFENDDGDSITMEDMEVLLDDATETSNVTIGDRLIIEVEATGMYGSLLNQEGAMEPAINTGLDASDTAEGWNPNLVHELNERHEGVRIGFNGVDSPGMNRGTDTNELVFNDVGTSQVYIVPNTDSDSVGENGELAPPGLTGFYVIVDTRDSEPFASQLHEQDEFEFELAYESPAGERYTTSGYSITNGEKQNAFNPSVTPVDGEEHFPYFGDSDTTINTTAAVTFNEQTVTYDSVTRNGELVLPATGNHSVTGTTSLPQGSEMSLQITSSSGSQNTLSDIRTIEVGENGEFELPTNFTLLEPRDSVQIELYNEEASGDERMLDKRQGIAVSDYENPSTFNVTSVADNPEVEQGDRLTELWGDVTNDGDVEANKNVEFSISGEGVDDRQVVLSVDETERVDLSNMIVTISPGEYDFEIRTEDDSETGTLTVVESTSGDVETSDDSIVSEVDGEDEDDDREDEESPDDEDGSGLVGLVGLRVRDVVIAGAITSVVYVLGALN